MHTSYVNQLTYIIYMFENRQPGSTPSLIPIAESARETVSLPRLVILSTQLHTANFILYLEITASVSDVFSATRVGGAREQLSGKLLPRRR